MEQFCFGSAYLQLNPNYRRLERLDPLTWKKEGITAAWAGARGLRKSCCKVCCQEPRCGGCRECDCRAGGPVRGGYDGLVVLTCLTRETQAARARSQPACCTALCTALHRLEQDELAAVLEHLLTVHFLQASTTQPGSASITVMCRVRWAAPPC